MLSADGFSAAEGADQRSLPELSLISVSTGSSQRALQVSIRRDSPRGQKCKNLSRLLHFCAGNEGCAFINDRKLIAGDAVGWSTSFAWKPKTTVKRREPNARCRTLPTSWRLMK